MDNGQIELLTGTHDLNTKLICYLDPYCSYKHLKIVKVRFGLTKVRRLTGASAAVEVSRLRKEFCRTLPPAICDRVSRLATALACKKRRHCFLCRRTVVSSWNGRFGLTILNVFHCQIATERVSALRFRVEVWQSGTGKKTGVRLVSRTECAVIRYWLKLLLWAHFDSWCRIHLAHSFSGQALLPGAHLCNGISAVSYNLYMH